MGQVNMSLADETKKCLADLQEYFHCASISETVTRLVWDAKKCIDDMNMQIRCADRSDDIFDIFELMVFAKNMMERFTTAFRNDYVYSSHEFEGLAKRGMISDHADRNAFIYGTVPGVYSDMTEQGPVMVIYKSDSSYKELVTRVDAKWTGTLDIDYWRVNDITGIQPNDIMISPVLVNTEKNKLMESMPQETGLSFMKAIGFQISHRSGRQIIALWNPEHGRFDMALK